MASSLGRSDESAQSFERQCTLGDRGPSALTVILLVAGVLAGCWPDASPVPMPPAAAKDPNVIQVSADQMHQLNIVPVEPYPFRVQKQAIGQIAFNEDASTVVTTPFSGRVIRVLAKIG